MDKINTIEHYEKTLNTHDARQLIENSSNTKMAKIMLDNETYLLKITKQNKLILTK